MLVKQCLVSPSDVTLMKRQERAGDRGAIAELDDPLQ